MSDQLTDGPDVDRLIDEIDALRDKVAQLQARVEQLDQLAHQDSLVNLPNRRGFMRALERFIDRANRYCEPSALLYVDLDGLKMINDSFGHQAGDQALIQAAELLIGGVRKSDVVARIGGDEFGILLAHADEEKAHEASARLVDLIAERGFTHDGDLLPLSVAIGVTMIASGDCADAVIARADEEMYRRKAAA
ncbi:MAG TPA: GGDEF domain-containing protein [Sphingomicrobium sp.]|nr:GGDEF domain-containing protein [Sphingomicrobium sp.]